MSADGISSRGSVVGYSTPTPQHRRLHKTPQYMRVHKKTEVEKIVFAVKKFYKDQQQTQQQPNSMVYQIDEKIIRLPQIQNPAKYFNPQVFDEYMEKVKSSIATKRDSVLESKEDRILKVRKAQILEIKPGSTHTLKKRFKLHHPFGHLLIKV